MAPFSRRLLLLIALLLVFGLVWSRVRILLTVSLSLWQALLLFGIGVLVVFLILDHLLNRTR